MTDSQLPCSAATEHALLPCPFCGGKPVRFIASDYEQLAQIRCENDECFGPWTPIANKKDADAMWNRRMPDAAQTVGMRTALEDVSNWLEGCLQCKTWSWDGLQRDAAERALKEARAALETAPLRICGYCKSWNSKPCGEGCCWSPTDPTIEKVRADDLKAKQKHNRKHPLPVTFGR